MSLFLWLAISADAHPKPELADDQDGGKETAVDPATAIDPAAVRAGRASFEDNKCANCHAVDAAEIQAKTKSPKMLGPDLSGFTTDNPAEMAAFLRKTAELDGERHKQEFKGSDEELQSILTWLGSLESP